jgi:hypothetical protein
VAYDVQDAEGNDAVQVTRTVTVENSLNCPPPPDIQTGDLDRDGIMSLSELLRIIQLYNLLGYHCADNFTDTVDGFVPSPGANLACTPHTIDYNVQNWIIELPELLRAVQFFNVGGYTYCPGVGEDNFCPVVPTK